MCLLWKSGGDVFWTEVWGNGGVVTIDIGVLLFGKLLNMRLGQLRVVGNHDC